MIKVVSYLTLTAQLVRRSDSTCLTLAFCHYVASRMSGLGWNQSYTPSIADAFCMVGH